MTLETGIDVAPSRHDRACEGRKRSISQRREDALQQVFAVRLPPPSTGYGWEIRRFGSFVLKRGTDRFDTAAEAKAAGDAELVHRSDAA